MAVADAIAGQWQGGVQSLGMAQGAVALSLGADRGLASDVRERLAIIAGLLAAGSISLSP